MLVKQILLIGFLLRHLINLLINILLKIKLSYLTELSRSQITDNTIGENILIFSKDHTGHYKSAFELFKNSPVFGIGPKLVERIIVET